MASVRIISACARITGRATVFVSECGKKRKEKRVREGGWGELTHAHDDKEAGKEAADIEDGGAGALDKVVRVGAAAADPVGHGRDDVGGDDEQRKVRVEEGARQDDEQEAEREHKRQGNDGLEAGGRHGGRFSTGAWRLRRCDLIDIYYRIIPPGVLAVLLGRLLSSLEGVGAAR